MTVFPKIANCAEFQIVLDMFGNNHVLILISNILHYSSSLHLTLHLYLFGVVGANKQTDEEDSSTFIETRRLSLSVRH